ncbi:MAG: hypothetical protein KME15_13950 [Drouetiella hepatica Uher 2000/2452]|jgi:hypothetical protein|uniref:Uncharacterized protein n=1 Tax=Drouetiella hepatica Uher 2000/2452 TaxID=904376 RepID=A0A951QDA6_9CYAN|nr:hypothetical protein [Drouetiella hepatica Uher 2000/2452]
MGWFSQPIAVFNHCCSTSDKAGGGDWLLQLRSRRAAPHLPPEIAHERSGLHFFALQLDFPSKLNSKIDVNAFCDRWELDEGDLYKALGDLRKKGVVVSIASQISLQITP